MSGGHLKQSPFYRDGRFAVAVWDGDAGDKLLINVHEPTPRSRFACVTVMMRGKLEMFDPEGKRRWSYTPGNTSLDGGDFDLHGIWEWRALASPTQEICISQLGANGRETDEAPEAHVIDMAVGETATVRAGSLIVIPVGGVVVDAGAHSERQLLAPHFARVDHDKDVTAHYSETRIVVVRPR
jgi:hypothetical protein